jgi:hypothetical protein
MTSAISALLAAVPGTPASNAAAGNLQVGYGVSLTDIAGFRDALGNAAVRLDPRPIEAPSQAAQQLMRPFEHINGEAARISRDARAAEAAGRDLSPSEMVMLTVRCQEFMFHCQLTSNIANRTSDGLQQLFRQQS